MVFSTPPLAKNILHCVALCCALVHPTKASWTSDEPDVNRAVREAEVLYAQLHSDLEYVVIPRTKMAVLGGEESYLLGLTKHTNTFWGRARSRSMTGKAMSVFAYDYIPYNHWNDTDPEPVDSGSSSFEAQILRVAEGKTSEYLADVVESGGCFKRIEVMRSSFRKREGAVDGEAPQYVRDELRQICSGGFAALKPSSSLPKLDGMYFGSRDEKVVKLRFRDGRIKDANLTVDKFDDSGVSVTYHPLCNGIISFVVSQDDTGDVLTFVILKKSIGELGVIWKKGQDDDTIRMQDHSLCNMEKHRRRTITQYSLDEWDRYLPESFILGRYATKLKVLRGLPDYRLDSIFFFFFFSCSTPSTGQ
ncbi:hypothetical protein FOZ62_015697, partial [Perkinsus olseni]